MALFGQGFFSNTEIDALITIGKEIGRDLFNNAVVDLEPLFKGGRFNDTAREKHLKVLFKFASILGLHLSVQQFSEVKFRDKSHDYWSTWWERMCKEAQAHYAANQMILAQSPSYLPMKEGAGPDSAVGSSGMRLEGKDGLLFDSPVGQLNHRLS